MVKVRDNPLAPVIAWPSWRVWRAGRRAPELVWFRDLALPVTADWCPTCWGNGRIFGMARNGEGLIPLHPCAACDGTGRVP